MKDKVSDKHLTIRVSKSELNLIFEIINKKNDLFENEQINDSEFILSFDDIDKVFEFDELIKDKLIYRGFDKDYNPNKFGLMCENMIDKLHIILNDDNIKSND